jgi:diguanylate cyclase (GGDEF)-like protein
VGGPVGAGGAGPRERDPAARRRIGGRALAGLALAQGAPLGWLLLRALGGSSPRAEIAASPGLYAYLLVSTSLVFAAFGLALGALEERLARANERLAREAATDALTGLANARTFGAELPRLVSYARRAAQPLALVAVDADRFKLVNDRFGHLAGDELLRRLGVVLAEGRRREDVVARVGGEEFALALPGVDRAGAERAAARVVEAVRDIRIDVPGGVVGCTVSAGIAELGPGDDAAALLARADAALYRAKRAGRDRVEPAPCA